MNELETYRETLTGLEIAVIGMSACFPGAAHVRQFLENLKAGKESIRFFTPTELTEAGVDPELIMDAGYVPAKGYLERAEYFDADFFGYTPAEAAVMDPQLRLFHRCTWEGLEDAGYDPGNYDGLIGLYGGASPNSAWQMASMFSPGAQQLDDFSRFQLTNKDNLTMRVSYQLNLKGPSYVLQTACSTSLTAIHVACQALLSGECHIAVAGGVTVTYPLESGYIYREGMVGSPDGHCRAFDAAARGTLSGDGCGVVVLKLLEDALIDHDHIYAVVKGSAVNNDGRRKTGYTAPSIKGQAGVIQAAQKMAGVAADSIGYIEAHGTATLLGDPIEIEALKQAFNTEKRHYCGIGSVKTNFGHLDSAAGVAGFIKAVLSIQERCLFPSLFYKTPNPKINFGDSPFFVPVECCPWRTGQNGMDPLRAGVSAFGIGGTNVHVILEEAPPLDNQTEETEENKTAALILLSARSEKALAEMTSRWVEHLHGHPDLNLGDAAYTLQVGRAPFKYRKAAVCTTVAQAMATFTTGPAKERVFRASEKSPVIFMFPGLGSQYVNMGLDLYCQERVFRQEMDECFRLLTPLSGQNFKPVLYPSDGTSPPLKSEHIAPILFAVEYALAKLIMSWGIKPHAMIGYSFGEYAVAAIAGVISLRDALSAIVRRGELINSLPGGAMTSVPLTATELEPLLAAQRGGTLALAIDNGSACIISGSLADISTFETALKARRLLCMRVNGVTHALHSTAMTPIIGPFVAGLQQISFHEPQIPYISNVTGDWITAEDVLDPGYWGRHLAGVVRFAEGIRRLVEIPGVLLVEVGPGLDLSTMVKRYIDEEEKTGAVPTRHVLNLMRNPLKKENDRHYLLNRLGYLWGWGVAIDWQGVYEAVKPHRVSLPTYPFEEQRYGIAGMAQLAALGRQLKSGTFTGTMNIQINPAEVQTDAGATVARPLRFIDRETLYVTPENETERAIIHIWENYFGIQPIGLLDEFQQLGGDSLKAMNIANLLREELGVDIPVAEFFQRQTVQALARYVLENARAFTIPTLEPAEQQEYYPLSAAQERLFVLAQMALNDTGYNEYLVVKLDGKLDITRFTATFEKLIARHESLRTGFILKDETPVQVIYDSVEFQLEFLKVEQPGLSDSVIRAFIRPFDLAQPPLLRVGLVPLTPESHLLLLDMHHIISDGTSQGILIKDFIALYGGAALPPLRIQYKDYCVYQKQQHNTRALEKQATFWLERFTGEIPVLNLPLDFPRPVEMDFAGGEVRGQFTPDESAALHAVAQQHGTTLYMVLATAYAILLSKLCGQEDIVMGTPTAGRRFAELHPVFGMFVNTLALRHFPVANKIAADFLSEVSTSTLQAFENQDYQFEELVDRVVTSRDISRNPLFDTMIIVQNMELPRLEIPGLKLGPYEFERQVTKFDLTLTAFEHQDSIALALEYRVHLFTVATIARFIRYFKQAALELATHPDQIIAGINILPLEEKELLLYQWNATAANFPGEKTIPSFFVAQAQRFSDRVALLGEHVFTYRQLDIRTDGIAASLFQQGIRPGTIVAVQLPRTYDYIIALIAILKVGAVYLPLDSQLPPDRIRYILNDSQAILLDTLPIPSHTSHNSHNSHTSHNSHPTHPCYIIYTSGSTGRPKGVVVEHASILNTIFGAHQIIFPLSATGWRVGLLSSFIFDPSLLHLFCTLLFGHALIVLPTEVRADGALLLNALDKFAIDLLEGAPIHLSIMLESASERPFCPYLKRIIVGGEALPKEPVVSFFQKQGHRDFRMLNMYGPTECAVIASIYLFDQNIVAEPSLIVSIGAPLANFQIYILDSNLRPQPIGVIGELYIGGVGVGRGYLNNPEQTATQFITIQLGAKTHRLYKTGDLSRWLANGTIEFCGRGDQQVKIRGYRIELGEIENCLLSHEAIKRAVVVLKKTTHPASAHIESSLCAYVVLAKNTDATALDTELKEYLTRYLPDYMIPTFIIPINSIPQTIAGKTDVNALPVPCFPAPTRVIAAPRDKTEETLLSIFREILGHAQVGVEDNFFHMGGHSLKATRLTATIHKTFAVRVPLAIIFKHPSVRQLALYLKEAIGTLFHSIEPVEQREYYPCSPAQSRMFVLQQMDPDSTVYNICSALQVEGHLQQDLFVAAFKKVITRHESLRTSFFMVAGEAVQKIHGEVPFALVKNIENTTAPLISSFIQPFDLAVAPLLRVGLFQLAEEKFLLVVDVHHIVSDGVSTDILIRDFSAFYSGAEPVPLKFQYKDIAAWQRGPRRGDELKQQEQYWLNQYSPAADIPVLQLPYDYPRPPVQQFTGSTITFELESPQTEALKQVATTCDATLYMVLMALFSSLLAKLSGQEDIVVGTPSAGRVHVDMEAIIGMFINTLAIRTQPAGEKPFTAFLAEVKEKTLQAFENQEYPFEELVEQVAIKRDAGRNPLFDVMLVLQNMDIRQLQIPGLTLGSFPFEPGVARFDLTLTGTETPSGLTFIIEYSTALFTAAFMQRFIQYFQNIVQAIIANPPVELYRISILSQAEQQQLLVTFNDTTADYPMDKTIHGLFTEQAQRTPDNIAVVSADACITYRQLNERADHLAHSLIEKGVRPDSIVAITMERTLAMIIGILAILKANGAYMPIDPDYPQSRQDFMLADSGATIHLNHHHSPIIPITPIIPIPPITPITQLSYVIYTSGTTGKPKGTLIEHRNVVRLMFNNRFQFQFDSSDRWTLFHSLCFDFSVWEMYGALLRGGLLVIVSNAITRDPRLFLNLLITQRVTVLNQTPAAFYNLAAEALQQSAPAHDLRYVIFGGEALKPANLLAWHQQYPQTRLINMYGITETTVHVTFKEIGETEMRSNTSNIGVPIPTLTVRIVDPFLQLVPLGVPGEMIVGGAGVARGYLNRPELTAARFVAISFNDHLDRYYRSGDLARWLANGEMEYLGRMDQQVKIRGFRVELGEIESRLLAHPLVKEAVVIFRTHQKDNDLCAYFTTTATDSHQTTVLLREYLSSCLASYMVPAFFVPMEQIPLTPNGKVDRRALPLPQASEQVAEHYQAPSTKIEAILVEVWSDVLGILPARIGTASDFFQLGGHSLKAIQVINGIHKKLQVRLPVQTMFQFPTIAQLAREISQQELTPFICIPQQPVQPYYELSYTQKRLWVLHTRNPHSAVFNMSETTKLPQEINTELIPAVVQHLVDRHESLRTSFREVDGEIVQHIAPVGTVKPVFASTDLSAFQGEELQQRRAQVIFQEGQALFQLDQAPLLRLLLVMCSEAEKYLVFTMFHLISDGWSLAVIQREFTQIYEALAAGTEPHLPLLTLQYRDYAVWHNKLMENPAAIQPVLQFWQPRLAGVLPVLDLPYDAAQSTRTTAQSAGYQWVIPPDVTLLLRELAVQHNTTMFTLLLAAFHLLLSFLREQRDIILALPGAARPHEDLKDMVGMFVNTLIMRTQIHEEETFVDFLQRINQDTMQILDYQVFPMELIFELLDIPYPKVSVFFNFQNTGESQQATLEEFASHHVESVQEAKFDLVFYLMEFKNGINIMCNYYKQLFHPATIEKIAILYTSILSQIAQDPNKPVLQYKSVGKRKKLQRG